MSIFHRRIVPSWRNPCHSSSIDHNPFARFCRPSWCTPVLLRAWDRRSWSALPLLDDGNLDPQGNGFHTYVYDDEDDDALEQDLDTLEKRAAALEAHATYDKKKKGYKVCFVSMQMDWDALMERARKIHNRRKELSLEGYTYITAIDAQKLSQKKWNLLRMAEELEAGNIQLEHYIPGGAPWNHRWYKDEVLAIDRIPGDCILGTFRLEDKDNWQMGATSWRDEEFVPRLENLLGMTDIPGFSSELFMTS